MMSRGIKPKKAFVGKKLSVADELAIMAYCDREASALQCLRAKFLLNVLKKPAAISFASKLISASKEFAPEDFSALQDLDCSHLWERIESQIHIEERALRFLRRPESVAIRERNLTHSRIWRERFIWSGSGAVAASIFAFAMVVGTNQPSPSFSGVSNQPQASEISLGTSDQFRLHQESAQFGLTNDSVTERYSDNLFKEISNSFTDAPDLSGEFVQAPSRSRASQTSSQLTLQEQLKADWVRSSGQISIVQDDLGGTAMIWVRPKSSFVNGDGDFNIHDDHSPSTLARLERRPSRVTRRIPSVMAVRQGASTQIGSSAGQRDEANEDYNSFLRRDTASQRESSAMSLR